MAHLEPTLKDLTWPHPRTAAMEELIPTSITTQNASSQNRGILKDHSCSWEIFGSKGSHPTSSPGIKSSILSDSYTPTVSVLLQIKITSGRPRQSQFSAIIIALIPCTVISNY
ncbi:hypothetical protein AVEN_53359-1 [Araneus ventricosus]|uniref:Uncharacterized protein n=1 Tax=Araneus ventricosus TaxID=182803 RepID=A0A4Y2ABR5_ARAVE|nr:hypothetical protein AVEN_53359-1 [Araneus ventricosus]